jgi:hypothetical protein
MVVLDLGREVRLDRFEEHDALFFDGEVDASVMM